MYDLAIFDDSYFESDLNFELDAATETVGDALSNFFTAFGAKIKQISEKNDIRVQDLVKCGYSEKEAIAIIKKSAIFFNQNGYAKKYIDVSTIGPHSVISYKDLNADGKAFSKVVVDTFKESYKKHSDEVISKFTQRARVKLASMESKEKIIVFVINLVISAIRTLFKIGCAESTIGAIPIIGSAISSGCAIAIIICALIDLGLISLIANYIIKGKYEKKTQKIMYTTNYRDANESLDVFDQEYFENDVAMEADVGLKRGIAGFLGDLPALIYELIHDAHIDRSVVVSTSAIMANGFSRQEAKKMASQTIEFFKKKGFLKYPIPSDADMVMYSDLNGNGQRFIRGYYDAIDDIQPADIRKLIAAKQTSHKSTTAGSIFSWIRYILTSFCWGFNIGMGNVAGIIASSAKWGVSYITLTKLESEKANRKYFDNTYIDVNESANIFDAHYFADANYVKQLV